MKYSKNLVWLLLAICLPLGFVGCSDDSEEDFSNVPGVENESWSSTIVCVPEGEKLEYTFKAKSSWKVSENSDWIQVTPTSGKKGNSQIKVTAEKNESKVTRTATITIVVEGYKSATLSLKQDATNPEPVVKGETEMNARIDAMLEKYYLWNGDYKKLTRNLDIPFVDAYDNFLRTTLMSMTTNTLDKKLVAGTTDYTLYSYVDRKPKSGNTRCLPVSSGVNHGVKKEDKITTYGISRLIGLSFVDQSGKPTGEYGFAVRSIYPGSSADSMKVKRGTIIYEVDGKTITESNYATYYLNLVSPTKNSIKLLIGEDGKAKEVTLETTEVDPSPILKNMVIEDNGHKIGYLLYDSFDAAYDDELLEVLADFKSEGITDLVLDLRYNGGGHVISSMMLSACIAGSKCKDQIFQYYRYNSDRMANVEVTKKETGNGYDNTAKYFYSTFFYDNYYGVNLSSYALNFDKVYVLVTSSSASASELLVNSLRGLGMSVSLIGEKHTNGKNVGMEVDKFDEGDYSYELAPITFQFYNSKKETVPATGLLVDYDIADWNSGYVDFGEKNEPMLAKAIELITGQKASSRSAVQVPQISANTLLLPEVNHHPEGAIVLHP